MYIYIYIMQKKTTLYKCYIIFSLNKLHQGDTLIMLRKYCNLYIINEKYDKNHSHEKLEIQIKLTRKELVNIILLTCSEMEN